MLWASRHATAAAHRTMQNIVHPPHGTRKRQSHDGFRRERATREHCGSEEKRVHAEAMGRFYGCGLSAIAQAGSVVWIGFGQARRIGGSVVGEMERDQAGE